MTYYVRMATRGSAKTGSPRQALNYITDAHDIRRDTTYSDAELHGVDPVWWTPALRRKGVERVPHVQGSEEASSAHAHA